MRKKFRVNNQWKFTSGFPKAKGLYNYHRARAFSGRGLIVTECPWGAIRLHQAGLPNAVALLGTSASAAQLAMLAKAPKLLLLFDGDAAGREGAERLRAACEAVPAVSGLLPEGADPDDLTDGQLRGIAQGAGILFS